jgi:glycosyltransferase involved in cell wall biosynthesis
MKTEISVSVIITVFNGERYIAQSIESILNQTFRNFELIVINDGSTDQTLDILQKYKRLKVISQPNKGISKSVNIGLKAAQGKYIARFDADDICYPKRLAKQVAFLEQNPEIGLVGSFATIIDSRGNKWGCQKMPISDKEIRWVSLFKSPFIQPSMMIRRSEISNLIEVYDPNFIVAEDYDLWIRLLENTKAANIPEPLIYYRVHSESISDQKNQSENDFSLQITERAVNSALSPDIYREFEGKIKPIHDLLFSGTRGYRSLGDLRVNAILDYLSLWDLYKSRNQFTVDEINSIQKLLIIKICQLTFFPPIPNHFSIIVMQLNKLNRKWPIFFMGSLPYALLALIRDRFLWKRI